MDRDYSLRSVYGFTLLEVMLAIAIFTTAGVGLLHALNIIGLATNEAAEQHRVEQRLKSLLNEYCFNPDLKAGAYKHEDIDREYLFEVEVSLLDLVNDEGQSLEDMYTVACRALLKKPGNRTKGEVARVERYVYRGLWKTERRTTQ
ncbi:MAG: prepilin-type N-terminal cleavage/methylation domain-containing protein [Verrucomicrobiales bacterium]|nr:prepilin-type N-terminal cleavage/methylation domain-containing protein [Verrucomicrobiales bacterium]